VLVATPGRLLDHIEAKNAVLNQVEYVVLDEADRMLDIGFLPDLQRILSTCPSSAPRCCSRPPSRPRSSAWPAATCKTRSPSRWRAQRHGVHGGAALSTAWRRRQAPRHPPGAATRGSSRPSSLSTASSAAARLARSLERDGLKTTALHGDKSQDERLKALEAFKQGEVDLLVATDVAARGLDIKDVPAVFNFDVPFNAEDYVHRIGRTGRAGASGLAVTLVSGRRCPPGGDIEKLIKTKIDIEASNTTKTARTSSSRGASTTGAAPGVRAVHRPSRAMMPRAVTPLRANASAANRASHVNTGASVPLWLRAIPSSKNPTSRAPLMWRPPGKRRPSRLPAVACRPTSSPSARWQPCSRRYRQRQRWPHTQPETSDQ
jgi:ATP-dependent RNA helicase RhlE